MIDRIIRFSIQNRLLVTAAGFLLAIWGVYAVYHTPMDAIPDLSENQVIVFTPWSGHGPHEIEDQITYPLSLELQGLSGVRVVRCSSDFNFSMINVIFEESVDLHRAREQLTERLARLEGLLPPGVTPALAADAVATGQIYWYTVEGDGYDLGRLRSIQDWYVKPQLSSVPGVAEVASVGGFPIEYQVEVDPDALKTHGLTLAQVELAVAKSNSAVGGHVIHKGNAEYVVRSAGKLGQAEHITRSSDENHPVDPHQVLRDLEGIPLAGTRHANLRLRDVAHVAMGPGYRRGILEKDGTEVTGGVVLMRAGENPLKVTERIKEKVVELQPGLPDGVRLTAMYDRTGLIEGAIHTVTGTLLEAIVTASICVLLVLLHLRTSFIIAVTLPLATLASFVTMWILRSLGIADIQTNVMSLAGIAISIGVLVDASIVMAENVMHHLQGQFKNEPVRGDVRHLVLEACVTVGRPIFFSVAIMILSFLPVFALGGIEGKMFRPLAFTKCFALLAVAALSITLVPALCTFFIRGRLRPETDNWLVRGVIEVYRPILTYLMAHPGPLFWFICATLVVGSAPIGWRPLFLVVLFLAIMTSALAARTWIGSLAAAMTLIAIGLFADQNMQPLGREFMTPLDEGMIMDMPITIPRASVVESGDDLKARDMMLCRFPEVEMVVGKAGRAETPTDPAPLDMIETMVSFRPVEQWPRRGLRTLDAERQTHAILSVLAERRIVTAPDDETASKALVEQCVPATLSIFDAQMREYAYERNREFEATLAKELGRTVVETMVALMHANGSLPHMPDNTVLVRLSEAISPASAGRLVENPELPEIISLARQIRQKMESLGLIRAESDVFAYPSSPIQLGLSGLHSMLGGKAPTFFTKIREAVLSSRHRFWQAHMEKLNDEIAQRAPQLYCRVVLEELLAHLPVTDKKIAAALLELQSIRSGTASAALAQGEHHHTQMDGMSAPLPLLEAQPAFLTLQAELAGDFGRWVIFWRKDRQDLIGFGGELDRVMQMPGWTNVWTMPIQNRVDMLSTGVNTAIGIRVLGQKLDDVVRASEEIARLVKRIPGAADVVADPVRGKGYLEIRPDREKAARLGIGVGDINDLVETALAGKVVTTTVEGRERHSVRVRFPRAWRESEESVGSLPMLVPGGFPAHQIPLREVADVRIEEGPASIKSENGLLRNYVRLNVRGRGALDFVDEARQAVAGQIQLPPGVFVEWTGQFEHEVRSRRTLSLIVPLVVVLIFLILYFTYHDLADACLMLLAVPGAIAGGILFQWLFGYKFSVTVWVGYIACFGMATSTGIIMLVYLREAVEKAGGLAKMTLAELKEAVLSGAVHRLRPKLLTEATIIIGLAPMLWATGTGAEVIKPMAAPVLGGILIADEVIDLLLPVLFYRIRRRRWERLHAASGNCGTSANSLHPSCV
jgi:Cu(I)/Ag(I) efflux system membrane protein CusA/SilA